MSDEATWFSDPVSLIKEIRRGALRRSQTLRIEGYDDLHEIRGGGQGVVFSGVQRSTRRRVAVKVLRDGVLASPAARHRFEREIDAVASLRHPNIVSIYDSGLTPEGQPYLVMEYIEGQPLDECVRREFSGGNTRDTARLRKVLRLFLKICEGVQHAHQNGVIHRDLKPSNIRIDASGEPRVLDFGLAKIQPQASNGEGDSSVSLAGQFIGSLAWASPEQAEAGKRSGTLLQADESCRVDVRTDVYSLGVILYHALTGRFPYDVQGSIRDVLNRIVHSEPLRPSSVNPDLGDELDTIMLKCLAKIPDRRYASVGQMAQDLQRYLVGEPIEARRDSMWYVVRKKLHRYRMIAALVSVFSIFCVVFGVTMVVFFQRARRAERLAQERLHLVQAESDKNAAISAFLNDVFTSVDAERDGYEVKVTEVLDRASASVNGRLADHPDVRAALLDTLGSSFRSLGHYEKAERLLTQEFNLQREHLGDNAPQTLQAMSSLAVAQLYAGQTDQAKRTVSEVLNRGEHVWGQQHPDYLIAQGTLAQILFAQGNPKEAVALERRVLAVQRRVLSSDHRDTLATMRVLGGLLREAGLLTEAESLLREAQKRCTRQLGESHPDTLTAINNLALVLDQQGQWDEAEALFRRSLKMQKQLRGSDHPETLTAMSNLAHVLHNRGKLEDAASLYLDVLDKARSSLGATQGFTLSAMNNLARVLHDQGKLNQALPLLREAYAAMQRLHGDTHPDTMTTLGSMAGVLADKGELDQAEMLFSRLLEQQRRALGVDHPSTLITWNNLAGIWRDQEHYAKALHAYEEVIAAAVRVYSADHWFTSLCRSAAGWCLFKLKRYRQAEQYLTKAEHALQSSLGAEHHYTLLTKQRLDELHAAMVHEKQDKATRSALSPAKTPDNARPYP